ncbi:DUF2163 domain-containing protein [uncultured Parvibaculum sp.]|uniref:DUF2163 domain-containing protein n=1 Tax=uncultured Parvibaculum sp. TaxID=291828 RepID=UPI0030D83CAD
MKQLDADLAAHLTGGATTLAWCWKLARRDGALLGFTDHDRDLVIDGVTFEAAAGISASAMESHAALQTDNLEVEGALSSLRIDEADLMAGLYDDADVELWRVNWAAPDQRVLMRKGHLGEVTRSGASFRAELRGLAHRLNEPRGRLFQYTCDADLGDARCGVDLTATSGEVTAATDNRLLTVTGLESVDDGWFTRGRIGFTSGANEGVTAEVKRHAGDALELWQALPRGIAAGDTVEVTPGCDKSFATCRAKFSNGGNFRGCPHMPGNDYVLSGVTEGGTNDGGKRG